MIKVTYHCSTVPLFNEFSFEYKSIEKAFIPREGEFLDVEGIERKLRINAIKNSFRVKKLLWPESSEILYFVDIYLI